MSMRTASRRTGCRFRNPIWHGFALLTIILTVATIAGMVAFTGLALIGIEQVKLRSFEKYEAGVMGALLCAVGVLIILFEQ